MDSAARWVLGALKKTSKDLAFRLQMNAELFDKQVDELFINYDADYSFTPGEGMEQSFARGLALELGVHRAVFDCDQLEGLRQPVYDNLDPNIDGNFGTACLELNGSRGMFKEMTVPQSSAHEFLMPHANRAISFLDGSISAHVLRIDTLKGYRIVKDQPCTDVGSKLGDMNPEALQGLFEIIFMPEVKSLYDPAVSDLLAGLMTTAYVDRLRDYFADFDIGYLRERLLTVEVHLIDGTVKLYKMKPDQSDILASLYSYTREGTLPPFFILTEDDWVEGIPFDRISLISIPWVLITRTGAHIDADFEMNDAPDVEGRPGDETIETDGDDDSRLILTGDLLRKKGKT